ncbi:hypothetical protein CR513_07958, partial [Mucuna pruriens]
MQVGQLADTLVPERSPPRQFRIQKREESAWRGYEAIESYHNWLSLSQDHDQPKLRPKREPTPDCNNQPRVFHYHSPIEKLWQRDLRSMKTC